MIFNDLIIEFAAVDISLRKNALYDFSYFGCFSNEESLQGSEN